MSTVPSAASNFKKYHLDLVVSSAVVVTVVLLGFLVSVRVGVLVATGAITLAILVRALRHANRQVDIILHEELQGNRRQNNVP